ncbi:MAG: sigma-70 family RNA polymerase sigma factor [Candidatus Aminicenantes bacterium]|nr:MAG: sigma-70 family RNA polymerase sigma factor [Candidatus Aminicenantes bacterium]
MNLEELYDRYGEKLYHYLVLRLGSCQDAEDILQEVFYRFSHYSMRWKWIKNPKAFAFRVVRNEANRFLKRKIKQQKTMELNPDYKNAIASVIQGPDQESENLLARSLSQLPDNQREVILLKVFEGMTFKEIARICRLSANTAASRYRYGLSKLRFFLEEKHGKGK